MDFKYSSHKKYLEAYKYLLRVSEPFSYIRTDLLITVETPDDELIKRLQGYNK